MFGNLFQNKKIIITGNTGFKGSWLTTWLLKMRAEVYGISIDIPTRPSMFEALELEKKIHHDYADINDLKKMTQMISEIKPDFLFHLAAQPIVAIAYTEPVSTIQTNVVGTANVLDALRKSNHQCTAVIVSSDKCYENVEWDWGYKETDHLGGKDPYSASKGACEIITHAYYHSFFRNPQSNIKIASARSGNVIGGGDWAERRLVPDCIRAWSSGKIVEIRNPAATRPWQHVLEPVGGYLCLAAAVYTNPDLNGEPYNFGPPTDQVHNVLEVIAALSDFRGPKEMKEKFSVKRDDDFYEARILKLNCDKALADLKWQPVLEFNEATMLTKTWYEKFYQNKSDMFQQSLSQIDEYLSRGKKRNLEWIS